MQTLDTRNFTEIVKSLTHKDSRELAFRLMQATRVSDRTIRNWYSGKYIPEYCKRQIIAKEIKKMLGINTNSNILFYGQ